MKEGVGARRPLEGVLSDRDMFFASFVWCTRIATSSGMGGEESILFQGVSGGTLFRRDFFLGSDKTTMFEVQGTWC